MWRAAATAAVFSSPKPWSRERSPGLGPATHQAQTGPSLVVFWSTGVPPPLSSVVPNVAVRPSGAQGTRSRPLLSLPEGHSSPCSLGRPGTSDSTAACRNVRGHPRAGSSPSGKDFYTGTSMSSCELQSLGHLRNICVWGQDVLSLRPVGGHREGRAHEDTGPQREWPRHPQQHTESAQLGPTAWKLRRTAKKTFFKHSLS